MRGSRFPVRTTPTSIKKPRPADQSLVNLAFSFATNVSRSQNMSLFMDLRNSAKDYLTSGSISPQGFSIVFCRIDRRQRETVTSLVSDVLSSKGYKHSALSPFRLGTLHSKTELVQEVNQFLVSAE